MLSATILKYVDNLEEPDFMAMLLAEHEAGNLIPALAELLESGDHEQVSAACFCIRDLVLLAPNHHLSNSFRDSFQASSLVPILEKLLLADGYFPRGHAAFTLGKTCCRQSVPALENAFEFWLDKDPLILSRLVSEQWWLEDQKTWSLIDRMSASPHFLTRWAALQTLSGYSGFEELNAVKERCFGRLREDEHPLVRAEAEHAYQLWRFERKLPELSQAERKQRRKEIDHLLPEITFDHLVISFHNYLSEDQRSGYTLTDLETFLANQLNKQQTRNS